jgi:hypothetical protein
MQLRGEAVHVVARVADQRGALPVPRQVQAVGAGEELVGIPGVVQERRAGRAIGVH